ncbi:MAG: heme-binding protein [Lachnospiraceae bacterium]|nr:heme-binding protein [Lachnospiraceae bacterium]
MNHNEIEAIVRTVLGQVADDQSKNPAAETKANLVAANGGKVQMTMTLDKAVKLIEKVEEKAAEWDMRIVAAVSDASGRPVAIHCMDGAYMGSFDVALNKTFTSIAFQMSTADLGKLAGPGESLYGIQFTNEGKIVIFGGGEVLKKDGVIIGALGVSGGSAQQDSDLAAYGKSIFEEVIACL